MRGSAVDAVQACHMKKTLADFSLFKDTEAIICVL